MVIAIKCIDPLRNWGERIYAHLDMLKRLPKLWAIVVSQRDYLPYCATVLHASTHTHPSHPWRTSRSQQLPRNLLSLIFLVKCYSAHACCIRTWGVDVRCRIYPFRQQKEANAGVLDCNGISYLYWAEELTRHSWCEWSITNTELTTPSPRWSELQSYIYRRSYVVL